MKNSKWSLLHVPVISALLFVTIITAAPSSVSSDLNLTTVKTAMGALYPRPVSAVEPVISAEAKGTPTAITPTTVNTGTPSSAKAASTATPAKTNSSATATKQAKTQPSRSSSTLTPTPASSQSSAKSSAPALTKPSAQSSGQTSKVSAIIATAKQFIGVNYVYGGTTPAGFDCSGFVQYVFAKQGISLPRVSRDQYKLGTSVSFSNLKAGDLVFFSLAKNGIVDHVGIYVGNGQFINASSSKGVTIYALGSYWQSAFLGARRIL